MVHEKKTDKNLLERIGGEDRLVRVVEAVENVCGLPKLIKRIDASKIRTNEDTRLRMGVHCLEDYHLVEGWKRFAKGLMRGPSSITFACPTNFDDNINLLLEDSNNWQAVAFHANSYNIGLTLGKKEGQVYLKPTLTQEVGEPVSDPLASVISYSQAEDFLDDPESYLDRYSSGMPIFNNGLMTVGEFGDYQEMIDQIAFEESSGHKVIWRIADNQPAISVMASSESRFGGEGNVEGKSLFFRTGDEHITSTPLLIFEASRKDPIGATLIQSTIRLNQPESYSSYFVQFRHSSYDQYLAAVYNQSLEREANSRNLLNIVV